MVAIMVVTGVLVFALAYRTYAKRLERVTATRLARYAFEEMFELKGLRGHLVATLATLVPVVGLLLSHFEDAQGQALPAWKVVWPVFGTTNQLLAVFVLLLVSVWLRARGRPSASPPAAPAGEGFG